MEQQPYVKAAQISIIGMAEDGGNSRGGARALIEDALDSALLRDNLSAFVHTLDGVFDGLKENVRDYNLDEIEVSANISANGGISLIGSVSTEFSGGLKLVFKKKVGDSG